MCRSLLRLTLVGLLSTLLHFPAFCKGNNVLKSEKDSFLFYLKDTLIAESLSRHLYLYKRDLNTGEEHLLFCRDSVHQVYNSNIKGMKASSSLFPRIDTINGKLYCAFIYESFPTNIEVLNININAVLLPLDGSSACILTYGGRRKLARLRNPKDVKEDIFIIWSKTLSDNTNAEQQRRLEEIAASNGFVRNADEIDMEAPQNSVVAWVLDNEAELTKGTGTLRFRKHKNGIIPPSTSRSHVEKSIGNVRFRVYTTYAGHIFAYITVR